jgi:WD40 repeat protein
VSADVEAHGHKRHQHKNTVQALAWSPNGNLVASASRDLTVRVFDIRAMKEFRVLKGHKKEVCCQSLFLHHLPCIVSHLVIFWGHSARLASYSSHSGVRRLRRIYFALGPCRTRGHFHTAYSRHPCLRWTAPRDPLPSTRLQRVVSILPSVGASPRFRLQRPYHPVLVSRAARGRLVRVFRRWREAT